MVYRDYWALSQWYAHYGRRIGEGNLFIVAHGSDPMVQALCPRASVIAVPRDNLKGFDRVRSAMLNSLQNALGHVYDWVIRTDADELVCLDPAQHSSFPDMLSRHDAPALFALGMNVVEMDDDVVLKDGEPALCKRSNIVFSGHYSKAWAVRDTVALNRHGIKVRPVRVDSFNFVLPSGVYLAHLKFANRAAMTTVNSDRMNVADSGERGVPGKSWQYAKTRATDYFQEVAAMPLLDWQEGMIKAFDKLQKPVLNQKDGLIRTQSQRFKYRTVLPDWFKTS